MKKQYLNGFARALGATVIGLASMAATASANYPSGPVKLIMPPAGYGMMSLTGPEG